MGHLPIYQALALTPLTSPVYNGTPWQRQLEYPAMEQVVALAAPSSR